VTAVAVRAIAGRSWAEVRFAIWSTTALALVTEPAKARAAEVLLRAGLAELDQVCNRFRADSEIQALEHRAGSEVTVSPLLAEVLEVALRAADLTDGLVDPTVGAAIRAIGYDRDLAAIPPDGPAVEPVPAPGWWRISWDRSRHAVLVPRGVGLDVGATAKALAADRAATILAKELGCGVLVGLGGDIAVAGPPPSGGWRIQVGDDHTRTDPDGGQCVAITSGGLATSGTARRRWRRGGAAMHHIIDPRTGAPAGTGWRTVSVAAGSCVDANTASTAAVVLGATAPAWLAWRGLPARLVAEDGTVCAVADWPDPATRPAAAEPGVAGPEERS
jgi:thiamine biosynthesis lipoprotein